MQCILHHSAKDDTGIALAIFSNGGAATAAHLATVYRKATGPCLPSGGKVLDSAVGAVDVNKATAYMVKSMPRMFKPHPLRVLAFAAIWITLVSLFLNRHVGVQDPITPSRIARNSPALFWNGGRRCYIYSRGDELVQYEEVEKHGAEAETRGWKVSMEMFIWESTRCACRDIGVWSSPRSARENVDFNAGWVKRCKDLE